jgi:hypothetical protein
VNKEKGMVLILVLLFMQIFAWLSLSMLENHIISVKMSRTLWQKHQTFIKAENILKQIENEVLQDTLNCVIPVTHYDILLSKSLDWWNEFGCGGIQEKFQYSYVLEKLASSCTLLSSEVALHIRITLRIQNLTNQTKEILQSTLVKIDNATQNCQGMPQDYIAGRRQWRQL